MIEPIPFDPLEIHITHNCNLSCKGCNHYSNFKLKPWTITIKEFKDWVEPWYRKINPSTFNILGGEPTIHPDLCEILELASHYFPNGKTDKLAGNSSVCLNTNGFFLHKHPNLKNIMFENKIALFISIHHNSMEYLNKIKDNLEMAKQWKEEGLNVTLYDYSIRKEWYMFYKEENNTIVPFNDVNPRLSWERCSAKKYPQLFEGKIWKCAPITYLKLLENLDNSWNPYLNYKPLESNATAKEIIAFLKTEDENICSMCPSNPKMIDIPMPMPMPITVKGRNL